MELYGIRYTCRTLCISCKAFFHFYEDTMMNSKTQCKPSLSNDKLRNLDTPNVDISGERLKCLSLRLLPQIKKYYSDESVRREFEEWKKKINNDGEEVKKNDNPKNIFR